MEVCLAGTVAEWKKLLRILADFEGVILYTIEVMFSGFFEEVTELLLLKLKISGIFHHH